MQSAAATGFVTTSSWKVQLDPFGPDAVRVRMGPSIIEPKLQALLPGGPEKSQFNLPASSASARSLNSLSVGNLNVSVDPSTNLILARRISDGKVLLNQTATFSAPPIGYRNATEGAFSAKIQFAGHGPDEVLFGFGEQRQAQLRRIPFFSLFENDQRYPVSYGG